MASSVNSQNDNWVTNNNTPSTSGESGSKRFFSPSSSSTNSTGVSNKLRPSKTQNRFSNSAKIEPFVDPNQSRIRSINDSVESYIPPAKPAFGTIIQRPVEAVEVEFEDSYLKRVMKGIWNFILNWRIQLIISLITTLIATSGYVYYRYTHQKKKKIR